MSRLSGKLGFCTSMAEEVWIWVFLPNWPKQSSKLPESQNLRLQRWPSAGPLDDPFFHPRSPLDARPVKTRPAFDTIWSSFGWCAWRLFQHCVSYIYFLSPHLTQKQSCLSPRCVRLGFKCFNVNVLTIREVPKQGYKLYLPTRKARATPTYRCCP